MTEKEISTLNEGRVLRMAGSSLIPLLTRRRDSAQGALIGAYHGGDQNLITKVAELAVLQDLIDEINRKINHTAKLEEKHHGTK